MAFNSIGSKILVFPSTFSTPYSSSVGVPLTVKVRVVDKNGNLLTSDSYTVSLSSYSDSGCTVPNHSGADNTFATASTVDGIATFADLTSEEAGNFYIRASADGLISACSALVTFIAGSPDHLEAFPRGQNTTSRYFIGTIGSSIPVNVQVVDYYGNAVAPSSAITVDFSVISGGGSISTSLSTDATGYVGTNYTSSTTSGVSIINATSASLPNTASLGKFIVVSKPGAPAGLLLNNFPLGGTILDNLQWLLVIVKDASGNFVRDFPGSSNNLVLSSSSLIYSPYAISGGTDPASATSSITVPFTSNDGGMKFIPIGFHSFGTFTLSASANSGALTGSLASIAISNPSCGTAKNWIGGDTSWSTISNWSPAGAPSATDDLYLASAPLPLLPATINSAQCVNLLSGGGLTGAAGAILQIYGNSFIANSGSYVNLSPGTLQMSSSPSMPQQVVNQSGALMNIDTLTITNSTMTTSLEGGMGYNINNFNNTSSGPVYINTPIRVNSPLSLSSGNIVITGTGSLGAMAGIALSGSATLTINGGGRLYLGDGTSLVVSAGGTLKLQGTSTARAAISALNGGSYSFTVGSGGVLNASDFLIDSTDANGLNLSSASVQLMNGWFTNSSSTGYALQLGTGVTGASLINLQFQVSSGNVIYAGALTSNIAVVNTYLSGGGTTSLKSKTYDPNNWIIWSSE